MDAPLHDVLSRALGPAVIEATAAHGLATLVIAPGALAGVVAQLKTEFGFDLLLDVTAIDWPLRTPRFDVVHHFYSTKTFTRVRVKTRVPAEDPSVETLTAQYGAARFLERECHDMYGIGFRGNADLRPILLYEGFVGHPLRKDYPKQQEQPLVRYRTLPADS